MGLFYFLGRKKFYVHLLIAIVLSFVLLWVSLLSLDIFTRHGKVYIVPDFYGQTLPEIIENNYDEFFDLQIIDSVFDKEREKGSVILQNPLAGSKVKKGRHVYLTIVAEMPEKVAMPNLKNLSLRQALVTLEAQELLVGRLEYTEYFARNAVVDQLIDEEPIEPGTELRKGATINLVIGKGDMSTSVALPMLIGVKKKDVKNEDPKWPAYKKYFMHGTSHHMGLDTHDYGILTEPMQAGMVFTVEPGIYIPDENLGIRIEDDYVIQKTGEPFNLMANIPITVDEIEALMASAKKSH